MIKDVSFDYVGERYCAVYKPENRQPIYGWASESGITLDASSPIAGAYRIENSPTLQEPFDAFQDDGVRMVTTVGPNQGGRTKAMEIASLWAVTHRAGPSQWNGANDKKAKQFAEKRWWPMARSCNEVRDKLPTGGTGSGKNRHQERICDVIFNDGSSFVIQGCSDANLQENSIMTQFNDECFQWPLGQMEDAWIRCNVAYAWNYKVWNGSVAGEAGHDLESTYLSGTQEEWHWKCPKCKKYQIPKFGGPNDKGGIKFKRILFPDKEYDFEAIKKTVYYQCEDCPAQFKDSSKMRRVLNSQARYFALNPNAPNWHRSFKFNILAVNWPGLSWGKWVEEFLKATEAWRKFHNAEPLKLFWTRRMAEFWEENKFLRSQRRIAISDYKLGSPNFYATNKWEQDGEIETIRFMGVDKQEDYYPAVIRAVMKNGKSRLVWWGNLSSYTEIDLKAKEFGVINNCVLLDFGYEMRECAQACVKYGWTGMQGRDKEELFKHVKPIMLPNGRQDTQKVELPWSEEKWKDPMMGEEEQVLNTRIPLALRRRNLARYYQWINLPIKEMLTGFKQGSALYWGVPEDVGAGYRKQLDAEIRFKIVSAKGKITYWYSNRNAKGGGEARANHAFDAECMIFTAMCMNGLIDLRQWNLDSENEQDKKAA